mgnify:CR=1 FL=1
MLLEAAQVEGPEEAERKRQQGDEPHPRRMAVLAGAGAMDGPARERGGRQSVDVVTAQEQIAELPVHRAMQAAERQGDESHAARPDEAETPAARVARGVQRGEHQRQDEDVHGDVSVEEEPEEDERPGQRPGERGTGPAVGGEGAGQEQQQEDQTLPVVQLVAVEVEVF